MPVLENGFGCVKLQVATLFIGWTGCIYCIWSMACLILDLRAGDIYFSNWILFIFLVQATDFFISVNFIRAAQTEDPALLYSCLGILVIELGFYNGYMYHFWLGAPWQFIVVLLLAMNASLLYIWLILFSYYEKLQQQQQPKNKTYRRSAQEVV